MKKNNILLGCVLIAFVLCVICIIVTKINTPVEEEITNVDLSVLDININSQTSFGEMTMQEIDKEILKNTFNIDEEKIEEVIGKTPLINVYASTYVIVKVTETNAEYVKEKFEEYGNLYEKQWENYLPEQFELVKKRKIGIKGDYVYFIVSDSSDEIVNMIK